ncbi:MAG: SRPBCC domain-containing protein [Chloroflexi bacterium]|nr:SRPBCC domain-containing protein [Chloroflexota bacterium]
MPTTIHKTIEINATIEQVWRYLGSEAGLRQWWGSDIRLEAKQGGRCEERSLFNGKPHYLAGEVTVFEPPRQLVLNLRRAEELETWPAFTIVSITLKESAGRTLVTLEHQAYGALAMEQGVEWTMPTVPVTRPARQVISNQWPRLGLSIASNTVAISPNNVWLHECEVRWNHYFEQLKQLVSAT